MRRGIVVLLSISAVAACDKGAQPRKGAENAAPAAAASTGPAAAPAGASREKILHPDPAKISAAGPDSFRVHVVTSKGEFDILVRRAWSPMGADRLYYLVSNGFYDGVRFYRVIGGFMAQFGAAGDTAVAHAWDDKLFLDEPVQHSNTRGTLTFAKTSMPNSRTTQLFINFGNNGQLDGMGFAPIGQVTGKGMSVVDSLYNGYGEGAPAGRGPDQGRMRQEGNAYLQREFPKLDSIVTARVAEEWKKK